MEKPRFSCDFTMDEALFREYFSAKDRSLNKRDGLIFAVVTGVTLAIYLWATWLWGGVSTVGLVVGIIIALLFVYGVTEAIWGYTVWWPDFAWRKTYQRYFTRHGVSSDSPRPWSCELYSAALANDVQTATMEEGRPGPRLSRSWKNFDHVEVTEHLVVLVAKTDVGSIWHNMMSFKYADKLMEREGVEDAIFDIGRLQGGSAQDLVDYLERKIGVRA